MKPTASDLIIARLSEASAPVPIHALDIRGVSQTSASARLRELARQGLVVSVPVPGKRFTSWMLAGGNLAVSLGGLPVSKTESLGSTPSTADLPSKGGNTKTVRGSLGSGVLELTNKGVARSPSGTALLRGSNPRPHGQS